MKAGNPLVTATVITVIVTALLLGACGPGRSTEEPAPSDTPTAVSTQTEAPTATSTATAAETPTVPALPTRTPSDPAQPTAPPQPSMRLPPQLVHSICSSASPRSQLMLCLEGAVLDTISVSVVIANTLRSEICYDKAGPEDAHTVGPSARGRLSPFRRAAGQVPGDRLRFRLQRGRLRTEGLRQHPTAPAAA